MKTTGFGAGCKEIIGYKNPTEEGIQAQSEFIAVETGCRVEISAGASLIGMPSFEKLISVFSKWQGKLDCVACKSRLQILGPKGEEVKTVQVQREKFQPPSNLLGGFLALAALIENLNGRTADMRRLCYWTLRIFFPPVFSFLYGGPGTFS
jgi:hypothetical protein